MNADLVQYAGSLAAVVLLVFVAWRLRLGGQAALADEAEARELADNAVCGFEPVEVALDSGRSGALLRDRAGRVMLLAPHGNRFVARLLDARAHARLDGNRLVIVAGERRLAPVALELADARAWCATIEALD